MSEITRNGDKAIVKPGKDVVASTVNELRDTMRQLLDEGAVEMAIDLSGVELMDSVGIGVLVAAHNSLKKNGGQLEVTNPSDDVFKLLKNMRLDQHFKI